MFYDDWLWYWQTRHVGPYDPRTEHAYPPATMASVLSPAYLARHGIGAVVVTPTARTEHAAVAAASSPGLKLVRSGLFDVYLVNAPTTIVTFGSVNATTLTVSDQHLVAEGTSGGGTALIRRNWFPRWRATVNGKPAPITETDGGYMTVPVPPGTDRVELTYAVDWIDWIARGACLAGLALAALLCVPASLTAPVRARLARRAARPAPT